tara:strand:+ start:3253 stop:3870 length:618 start_codon:yes stop_codon:yes gene_type:complete
MTPYDILALFLIMVCLAAIPSSSVALVVIRSATRGTSNGIAASCGIVIGDLVFVLMAVLGLSTLAEAMGSLFAIIRYLAAGYLIWFGIDLIRKSKTLGREEIDTRKGGIIASFTAGLTLTLGDIKVILFYASLFPAFVNIPTLDRFDIAMIMGITIVAVGSVKVTYAVAANVIVSVSNGFTYERPIKITAGGLMIAAGGYLITRA